jgi:hypothetical protein
MILCATYKVMRVLGVLLTFSVVGGKVDIEITVAVVRE